MKKAVWTGFCIVFVSLAMSVTAYAGNLNSAEQKALGEVATPFEYKGEIYRVTSSYIIKCQKELMKDDVDLTKGEVDDYVAQMRASRKELIDEGYCEKISDVSKENEPEQTEKPEENPSGDKDNPTDSKEDTNTDSEVDTKDEVLSASQAVATPTAEVTWDSKQELGNPLAFENEDYMNSKAGKFTMQESGKNYQVQREKENGKKTEKGNPNQNILLSMIHWESYEKMLFVAAIASVIALLAAFSYITFVRKRRKKKRVLRGVIAGYAGLTLTLWSFLICTMCSLYFGLFHQNTIHRQMMESDYFTGLTQMLRETAEQDFVHYGYRADIAKELFSLSNIYISEKQYIDAVISGEEVEIETEALTEDLRNKLKQDGVTVINQKFVKVIEEDYKNILDFSFGKQIYQAKQRIVPYLIGILIGGVMYSLLMLVMVGKMYGYLHKAVRIEMVAMLVASLGLLAKAFYYLWNHTGAAIVAHPLYYQQFMQNYFDWNNKVAIYVGGIGIIISIALFMWKRYLHMLYAK